MNRKPTLSCDLRTIDAGAVLQLLEGQKANGTLRSGELWLRFRDGLVVKSAGDILPPAECALAIVEELLATREGSLDFRHVAGRPSGPLSIAPTALLLEAARCADEARRVA